MDVVAAFAGEIGAMAAVPRFRKSHVGVGKDAIARLWQQTNERVVLRADNKRGNGDAVNDARG